MDTGRVRVDGDGDEQGSQMRGERRRRAPKIRGRAEMRNGRETTVRKTGQTRDTGCSYIRFYGNLTVVSRSNMGNPTRCFHVLGDYERGAWSKRRLNPSLLGVGQTPE